MVTIKELKKICRKQDWDGTTMYSRYFVRKFSIYLTKLLLYTPITANQVTAMNLITQLIGAVLLFTANLKFMLLGILLINFGFVLDTIDGNIARYRKKCTMKGIHLDEYIHQIIPKLTYGGIAFSVYMWTNNLIILLFGFFCVVFSTSIVNNTMCVQIVNKGLEYKKNKGYEEHFKSIVRQSEKLIKMGQVNSKYDFLINKASIVFRDPYDKLILLFLIILQMIYPVLFWTVVFYGSLFTLMQIASLIVHIRTGTIEKYFDYLFLK